MKSSLSSTAVRRKPVNLNASTPINEALKPLLAPLARSIIRNAPGVIQDKDIECLHELRVSLRRTRAALTQARHVFPARIVSRFRTEFGWVGRHTGPLRDFDVYLLEYRDERPQITPFHPRLLALISEQRERERHHVAKVLASVRFARLMGDWSKLLATPAPQRTTLRDARLPTKIYASDRIRSAYKRVRRQGLSISATSPDDALHGLRKTCKTLRYSIELFGPLFPKHRIRNLVRALKQLQDNLGVIQDSVVQVQTLRSLGEQLSQPDVETAIESIAHDREYRRLLARAAFDACFQAFLTSENRAAFKALFATT